MVGITGTGIARLIYHPSAPSGEEVRSELGLSSLKVGLA